MRRAARSAGGGGRAPANPGRSLISPPQATQYHRAHLTTYTRAARRVSSPSRSPAPAPGIVASAMKAGNTTTAKRCIDQSGVLSETKLSGSATLAACRARTAHRSGARRRRRARSARARRRGRAAPGAAPPRRRPRAGLAETAAAPRRPSARPGTRADGRSRARARAGRREQERRQATPRAPSAGRARAMRERRAPAAARSPPSA